MIRFLKFTEVVAPAMRGGREFSGYKSERAIPVDDIKSIVESDHFLFERKATIYIRDVGDGRVTSYDSVQSVQELVDQINGN